jgi:hypothetical protein
MSRLLPLAFGVALSVSFPVLAQDAAPGMSSDEPDAATEQALNASNVMTVRNLDRTEIKPGQIIYDAASQRIGTVVHLSGNDVVLTDGTKSYRVPFTQLFAYNQYGKDYFASRVPKAQMQVERPGKHGAVAAVD